MKSQHFIDRSHICFFLLYLLCNFILFCLDGSTLFIMLVWNVFLSFLPLLFSKLAYLYQKKLRRIWLFWAFLWIIFWPNTFYLVTDIVHFTGDNFFQIIKGLPYTKPDQIVYSTNLLLWSKGILIVLGILYGIMNGTKSETIFEDWIIDKYDKRKQIFFRMICSILGGTAIYIGRFLRFNSWDIFNPLKIIISFNLLGHNWKFVFGFIGLFTGFIFSILCFTKSFLKEKG